MERNAAQHHMRAWSTEMAVGMTASQRWEGICTAVLPQKFLVILQRSVLHSKMCFWLDSAPLQITMQSVTNLGAERLLEQLPCICLPLGWHSSSGLTSAWQLGANQACWGFPWRLQFSSKTAWLPHWNDLFFSQWYNNYLKWLISSSGKEENSFPNSHAFPLQSNHALYWALQRERALSQSSPSDILLTMPQPS